MLRSLVKAYSAAYGGLPREVWLLSFALFINRSGTMVLTFLSLYLHEEIGMSEGHAAQMLSCYGLGSVFGAYLGGWLTDRVGAIRLVIWLLILSVPVFFVIPFIKTAVGVGIAIFVLAIISEGVRPANNTAIAFYSTDEQQTRSFALQRMALNLGVSFGPAIGGFLAEVDYAWLFYADGITTLGCALVLIWAFGFDKDAKAKKEAELASKKNGGSPESHIGPASDPLFITFLGLLLIGSIVFFQFHATYPLYLKDHYGLKKSDIGLLFCVNTVMCVVFEMLLVNYAKRWNMMRAIAWGSLFSCVGFGILPFSAAIWFCVFSMVILTIGEMLQMPLASGWVGKRSTGRKQGLYMAWYSLTYSIAFVVAPLIGGWCYALEPDLFWYLSIAAGVISLVGFYWLASQLEREVKTLPKSTIQSNEK